MSHVIPQEAHIHIHLNVNRVFNSSISILKIPDLGATKIPSFNFAAQTFGNFLERFWNTCEFMLPIALTKNNCWHAYL